MTHFDFDEWASLYRKNPTEFQQRRKDFLTAEINSAPIAYRDNLHALQSECDAICDSLPPLESTIEISKLMVSKMRALRETYDDLEYKLQKLK